MPILLFRAIATTDPAISFNGRYLAAYLCAAAATLLRLSPRPGLGEPFSEYHWSSLTPATGASRFFSGLLGRYRPW